MPDGNDYDPTMWGGLKTAGRSYLDMMKALYGGYGSLAGQTAQGAADIAKAGGRAVTGAYGGGEQWRKEEPGRIVGSGPTSPGSTACREDRSSAPCRPSVPS